MHTVEEDQAPLLYLANTPYFPESDYVTREAKMFKLLKQNVLKQQEKAKAREDLLLQKQLELEAAFERTVSLDSSIDEQTAKPLQAHIFFFFCFCILFSLFLNYVFFIFYIYTVFIQSHLYLCFSLLSFFCYVFC